MVGSGVSILKTQEVDSTGWAKIKGKTTCQWYYSIFSSNWSERTFLTTNLRSYCSSMWNKKR